jgi:uncharacterized RDD family membrane protein YckC
MKTVDIITTQNVTIEYELASVGQRIGAFMIDFVVMIIAFSLMVSLAQLFSEGISGFISYLLTILFFTYTFIAETILHGQTLGKKALDIKVVKLNGEIPSPADNFLRWTFRLIDIWFSLGGLAVTLVSSNAKGQRLGNLATHTVVINKKSSLNFNLKDILNISALDNYTPVFPDVRRLNEQDMILIKTVLVRTDKYRNDAHYDARVELVKKIAERLTIPYSNIKNHEQFLKTLLKDYIVLTR